MHDTLKGYRNKMLSVGHMMIGDVFSFSVKTGSNYKCPKCKKDIYSVLGYGRDESYIRGNVEGFNDYGGTILYKIGGKYQCAGCWRENDYNDYNLFLSNKAEEEELDAQLQLAQEKNGKIDDELNEPMDETKIESAFVSDDNDDECVSDEEDNHMLCKEIMDERKEKKKELKRWLTDKVQLWEYYDLFIDNGFEELCSLKQINEDVLKEIGIEKIGHRMKLLQYIQMLQNE